MNQPSDKFKLVRQENLNRFTSHLNISDRSGLHVLQAHLFDQDTPITGKTSGQVYMHSSNYREYAFGRLDDQVLILLPIEEVGKAHWILFDHQTRLKRLNPTEEQLGKILQDLAEAQVNNILYRGHVQEYLAIPSNILDRVNRHRKRVTKLDPKLETEPKLELEPQEADNIIRFSHRRRNAFAKLLANVKFNKS